MAEEKFSYILQLLADTQGGQAYKQALLDVVAAAKQQGINLSQSFKVVDSSISTTSKGFSQLTLNIVDSGKKIDLAVTGMIQNIQSLKKVLLELNSLGGLNANYQGLGQVNNISPTALQNLRFISKPTGITQIPLAASIYPALPAPPQYLGLPNYSGNADYYVPRGGYGPAGFGNTRIGLPSGYPLNAPKPLGLPSPFNVGPQSSGFYNIGSSPGKGIFSGGTAGIIQSMLTPLNNVSADIGNNLKNALDPKSFQNITNGVKDLNELDTQANKTEKSINGLENNFGKLALRAATVVPIWLAVRSAFTSTIGTITDSAKNIIDLDTALKNAENEIKGTPNLPDFMKSLKSSSQELAQETGQGPGSVVEAFRQFATAGIDAKSSIAGMNTAVKGAIATNGDVGETARFLADVYNTLGDRITQVNGAQDKFNFIMSTIATLMPTNTFTLNEFESAATNFLATSKQMNLTLDQTFTLIATAATAMQRGSRAGTQLTSAFQQISTKGELVQDFLQKSIKGESSFQVFIDVLQKLSKAGSEVSPELQQIFGLRGLRVTSAEAATFSHVVDELDRLSKLSPNDRMAALLDRYGTSMNEISKQLARLKQIQEQLGKDFLIELFGGTDFSDTLKKINTELEKMSPFVKGIADSVKSLTDALLVLGGLSIIKNLPKIAELAAKITPVGLGVGLGAAVNGAIRNITGGINEDSSNLSSSSEQLFKNNQRINDYARIAKGLDPLHPELLSQKQLNDLKQKSADLDTIVIKSEDQLNIKLKDRLEFLNLFQTLGYNDLQIARARLDIELQAATNDVERHDAYMKFLAEEQAEIIKESNLLKDSVQGAFNDILNGKSSANAAFSKIGGTIKTEFNDAISQNITDSLFQNTGIGQIFGQFIGGVKNGGNSQISTSFDYGAKLTKSAIISGFDVSTNNLYNVLKGGSPTSGGGLSSLSGSGTGTGLSSLSKIGGIGTAIGSFLNSSIPGTSASLSAGGSFSKTAPLAKPPASGFGSLSGISVGQGLGAIGGILSLTQAYQQKGSGDILGGALSGAASGAAIGSLAGPIGTIVGALAGSLFSGWMAGQSKTTDSIATNTLNVASKIDVTNAQLQVVNRNLLALRQEITYILPDSTYFSESRNIADQFSINARRGLS